MYKDWPSLIMKWKLDIKITKPLIHHITNTVTQNSCANITLAGNGSPIMGEALEEVAEIASKADALVLNLGTPNKQRIKSMQYAGEICNELAIPIVFDPVGVGVSSARKKWTEELLTKVKPSVISGNNGEISALADITGYQHGIDTLPDYQIPYKQAKQLQQHLGITLAITGSVDRVLGETQYLQIEHGDSYLQKITGAGCMLNSVMALFLAVCKNDFTAAAASALAVYGRASEQASLSINDKVSPGSFQNSLFDSFAKEMSDIKKVVYQIQ